MVSKKNFSNTKNPALAFLGKIDDEEKINENISHKKEVNYDEETKYKQKIMELENKLRVQEEKLTETKSKKINLLVYPSVLNDFDKIAKLKGKSRNDLANIVFKEYCEKYEEVQ